MNKTVTFGEIMMRLTTEQNKRFTQNNNFETCFGGSEANVAVSLLNYGQEASFVTVLPENALGISAINSLRALGVDTKDILIGGDRIGLYFVEKGTGYRKQGIIYDRANSSIATANASIFNWEKIFEDADWFHFSGITPALSEETAKACLEAVKYANKNGITVSCDLNYREQLWSKEKANKTMSEICKYVDVCIAFEDEPQDMFSIYPDKNLSRSDGHKQMAKELMKRFDFKKVAITSSNSFSAMDIDWSALLYDGENFYFSKPYRFTAIDRIGGGDAFCGGFIYAEKSKMSPQNVIDYAVAAGCMKYTIQGDYNNVCSSEVKAIAGIK